MVEKSNIVKILDMNITELDLPEYLSDMMLDNNIKTIEDVVSYTEEELLNIIGMKKYIDILKEKLTLMGMNFKYKVTGHKEIAKTIEELNLSVKTYNVLRRAQITTVGDLVYADISNNRYLRNMGRSSYEEILLKLDEIGINPINIEIDKVEQLHKSLEIEKNLCAKSIDSIELKNIEVNRYCNLVITFSNPINEEWIEIFNKIRVQYFNDKCDSVEDAKSELRTIAKKLIYEIRLSAHAITSHCSAQDIMDHNKAKEILAFFIEYLNEILKLTHNEYSRNIMESSIKLKQLEIDEIFKNIEFIKKVFAKWKKISTLNNELRDLLKDIK